MVNQLYSIAPQLNKINYFHTESPFLDLDLSLTICIFSFKNIYISAASL